MTRHRGRSAAGAFLLAFLVVACTPGAPAATPTRAPSGAPPATTASTPTAAPTATPIAMTNVSIQLDFVLSGYLPLLWGQDKGYFESRGLNPDFIVGEGSSDALTAINTGAVDFAFLDGSNYIESRIAGESPTTAIYVWYPISTTGIISLEEITDPADMVGKSFGTVPFSSGKEKIPAILQANGVDYPGPDDPNTLVELMDFGVLYPTLFAGDIDTAEAGLAGSWENAKASAEDEGLTAFFVPISNWGYKDYSKLLLASDEIIASNPDLVSRVVAAISESELDALENATGDQMYQLLVAADPQAEEDRAKATWASVQEYMVNPGPIDPSVFQYQLDFIKSQGDPEMDPGDMTPEDLYTNEFIPE